MRLLSKKNFCLNQLIIVSDQLWRNFPAVQNGLEKREDLNLIKLVSKWKRTNGKEHTSFLLFLFWGFEIGANRVHTKFCIRKSNSKLNYQELKFFTGSWSGIVWNQLIIVSDQLGRNFPAVQNGLEKREDLNLMKLVSKWKRTNGKGHTSFLLFLFWGFEIGANRVRTKFCIRKSNSKLNYQELKFFTGSWPGIVWIK